ncbi:DUF4864 domain-containing protein [Marinivivus vitaminiproducens]|uniref:DUF4864 domain-containing protein n=1 Tax=Marinivivus vitaminiproducens TaxID=3035935 RepID=UPI00279CE42E|nr:DUF4864 domain-containing protein [Geminicoccaceae bacterium SCSIO 64248]
MRTIAIAAALVAVFLLAGRPAALAAENLDAADRAAIRHVIESQLDALMRDDGDEAFLYAAPAIQALFGSPKSFMAMVRQGYEAVYRPQEVEFRDLVEANGAVVQQVMLVGPDRIPMLAFYMMQEQADGTWRISGCILEPAPDRNI